MKNIYFKSVNKPINNTTMKKQLIKIIVITLLLLPASIFAQSEIDNLYKKYAGEDGFTSINISPEMFKFLSSIDMSDSANEVKQSQNVMEQLDGLKILVYEQPEDKAYIDFYKEIKNSLPLSDYAELMSIQDSESNIQFLIKKAGKNRISELLMIVKGDKEVLIMSMTGDIDMNTISDISNSLDVKGMENLDKLNDK